jgi:alpha-glucosidase (family GH31 glycosyl hydrolase)
MSVRAGDLVVDVVSEPSSITFRLEGASEPFLAGVAGRWAGFATGEPPEPSGEGWLDDDPPLTGWRYDGVAVNVEPAGDGVVAVAITAPTGRAGATFASPPGERLWGFGERSHAVDLRGRSVENRVGEGPYQLEEYGLLEAITPTWAIRRRRDATYFPIPWLLSSQGFGVLVDNSEVSRHRLGTDSPDEWSVEVEAPELRLRVFAGPRPADALRRFTAATGRQPPPAADWFFGPWFQTGHENEVPLHREAELVERLRAAGAPVSAAETHMRRLPGGAHVGRRDGERARAAMFHAHGLSCLTYFSSTMVEEYQPVFNWAAARSLFQRGPDGEARTFTAYAGGRNPPLAVHAQLDFTQPATLDVMEELVGDAVEDGFDGWMEDFGEYTPPDALSADGTPPEQMHNLFPLTYHRAMAEVAAQFDRPLARFVRSGWTGSAAYSPIVWGGDATTGWGFDGLRSCVIQALSMGLSGVAIWGSDIGGFFTLGEQRLTVELLVRWIQFGAVSVVMRTKSAGVAIPPVVRPQIWDAEVLPHWKRWAGLHTRLNPYLKAAAQEYAETGLPIMRHLGLMFPDDPIASGIEDQFLLGPDLLAAPVLEPGVAERKLYLPAGDWVYIGRFVEAETLVPLFAPRLEGPGWVTIPSPLDEMPLLARAGAQIPLLGPEVLTLRTDA